MYEVAYKELILDPNVDYISHFDCDQLTIVTKNSRFNSDFGIINEERTITVDVRDYSYIGFKEKLQRENENENSK